MSVTAMTWVWKHSTTAGNDRLVLLAIADCADDDGRNAWPSVATLASKTRLTERTIQRTTQRLQAGGHLIIRAGAGPAGTNVYRLVMTPPDPTAEPTPATPDGTRTATETDARNPGNPVIHSPVKLSPRQIDGGDTDVTRGVTPDVAPGVTPGVTRTSLNVHEPPPAREHATGPSPGEHDGGDGDPAEAFFTALGDAWQLSRGQRRRLHSAVAAALGAGWSPAELAAHVGANTAGVRNPYAVLRTRLTDLPDPPVRRAPVELRPPWCGQCDQTTRQVELDDGRPIRCPACHPLTATA